MSDLISRQAAIDAFERFIHELGIKDEPYNYGEMALSAQNVPSVENKGEWIPVSERLPEEENKRYWICTDCGSQCECRWTNVNHFWPHLTTDWHWHIMDIPPYSKVVAWMPLPESYKAERGK